MHINLGPRLRLLLVRDGKQDCPPDAAARSAQEGIARRDLRGQGRNAITGGTPAHPRIHHRKRRRPAATALVARRVEKNGSTTLDPPHEYRAAAADRLDPRARP